MNIEINTFSDRQTMKITSSDAHYLTIEVITDTTAYYKRPEGSTVKTEEKNTIKLDNTLTRQLHLALAKILY